MDTCNSNRFGKHGVIPSNLAPKEGEGQLQKEDRNLG